MFKNVFSPSKSIVIGSLLLFPLFKTRTLLRESGLNVVLVVVVVVVVGGSIQS